MHVERTFLFKIAYFFTALPNLRKGKEHRDGVGAPEENGKVQRRLAVGRGRVDGRARGEQDRDLARAARRSARIVERGVAVRVAVVNVGTV